MQAKTLVRELLYRCGVLGAIHALRNRRALTTLMFHRVLPADAPDFTGAEREFTFTAEGFGRCLDFVRRHYRCVTLHQVHDALQGRGRLPPNPVLITFDDGWRDTLVHAQQALQQRGLTGVLFLATEPLASRHALWWQYVLVHVLADVQATARLCDAMGVPVPAPGQRNAGQQLTARVAALDDDERHRVLRLTAPASLGGEQGRQMLSLADLNAFAPGCIELGAHGHTHAPLLHSVDAAAELTQSHDLIATLRQAPVTMSFPHGSYDARLSAMSRAAGFDMAFTSDPELTALGPHAQPFRLGRIHVPENEWTCREGRIDFALLATFLFFRRHA
jgi:peptidoglycan/xylan/chitin deacetylase (PgdA/CDA1 family)